MSPSCKRRAASGERQAASGERQAGDGARLTVDVLRGALEPGRVVHFTQGMKDEYDRVSSTSTPLPELQKGEKG